MLIRNTKASKVRALGARGLLGRFRRDAPSIDPKALQASWAVDPLPLPLSDGAKGLSAVDRTTRPPYVHARCERPGRGAAAARRPRWLEVRPGVVPDLLERAVELGPATADNVSRLQRLLRRVNRSRHHGEGSLEQLPREGHGGPKPLCRLTNDAQHVGEGGRFRLFRSEAHRRGADVRAVRGRAPALVESAARDRGLGMIPGDRLAAVECLAESNARRSEELASPRRDAAQLAIPDDVRDSLPALATRAAHLGEHRAERVWAGGIVRSAAEKPDAVVAQRHHEAALLVIEFGVPKELKAAAVRRRDASVRAGDS